MAKDEQDKDVVVRMVSKYRDWYQERFSVPPQKGSKMGYVIEYNTAKGIYNMLVGTFRAKNPEMIADDETILGMWQRLLDYLKEKNDFFHLTLTSIHRGYNTIIAQLMRHNEKLQKQATRPASKDEMIRKASIIQSMINDKNGTRG